MMKIYRVGRSGHGGVVEVVVTAAASSCARRTQSIIIYRSGGIGRSNQIKADEGGVSYLPSVDSASKLITSSSSVVLRVDSSCCNKLLTMSRLCCIYFQKNVTKVHALLFRCDRDYSTIEHPSFRASEFLFVASECYLREGGQLKSNMLFQPSRSNQRTEMTRDRPCADKFAEEYKDKK